MPYWHCSASVRRWRLRGSIRRATDPAAERTGLCGLAGEVRPRQRAVLVLVRWPRPFDETMPFHYFLPIPKPDAAVADQSGQVELVEWLVKEGDSVQPGTPVALARTWWAMLEIKAAGRGIVGRRIFDPGIRVKVGDPIAVIYADGEDIPYGEATSTSRTVEVLRAKPTRSTGCER